MFLPFSKKNKAIKKAEDLFSKGKVREAESVFKDYGYTKGLKKVADFYFNEFKLKKAFSIYTEIDDSEGMLKVLGVFKDRGNLGEIVKILKILIEKDGSFLKVAEKYGEEFLKEGELQKSEKLFSFLQIQDRREKLKIIFDSYLKKGDVSNCIRIARELDDKEKLKKIGYVYLNKDDFEMSKKVFSEIGFNEGLVEVKKKEEEFNKSKK